MKLAEWRKREGKTQEWLADALGCSQPMVSLIERAVGARIPGTDLMIRIFVLSCGAVQPNDFYELPALQPERKAA